MKRFKTGQRVTIIDGYPELIGKLGTVQRLRMGDDGAWIKMDDELPKCYRSFPTTDERSRNIMLYPDDCAVAKS